MDSNRLARILGRVSITGLFAFSLGLAACGAVGGGNTTGGTVCVASDFPVSGTDGSEGIPAQNGVELAVSQAKLHGNYTLQLKKFDDAVNGKHNATQGATNLTKMVGDSCIVAAVGPFNSNVAGAEIPIATANGLALISPSNTNPGLTLQQYSQTYGFQFDKLHPSGKPEAYFRVCANDVAQGKEVAKLATEAGYKKAYVAVTLKQHTAASGGTTANLAIIDHYYYKNATTLAGTETWTRVAQAAAATIADPGGAGTSAESQQIVVIEVNAAQLSDGYAYISLDVADTGSNAQLGCVLYLLRDLVAKRKPANLAAALA